MSAHGIVSFATPLHGFQPTSARTVHSFLTLFAVAGSMSLKLAATDACTCQWRCPAAVPSGIPGVH
jgi:hypothetical protein